MKLCPTCQTKYPDDANFCPQEACATPDGPQRLQAVPSEARPRFQPSVRIGGSVTGEVWQASDRETGVEVAYKIVSSHVLSSPAAQARAEREFKQLMRVQSAKIATIIECGKTSDDRLFAAMELCEGQSLETLLKGGAMPFDRAKVIVNQIGQGLLEAQKAGIVHRDVSPKNVLVSSAGDVKVINFPIATPVSEKVSGVPAYVSPEQAQGKPVDQRSNTYSLACIFYHLLTGEPPFQGATPEAVLELHVSSPALPPSQRRPEANLSPEIDRVILKALDKSSSRRHLTLRLFLTEVDALAAPGSAPSTAAGGATRDVGFAKTMLFAGGQAEVANLVAKAIAARTGAAAPASAAAAAPAAMPAAAVASTILAGTASTLEVTVAPTNARLTPPPVTPYAGTAVAPAAPATSAAAAPVADDGKGDPKAAFRETLWFKKGDVDQMVAEAKARLAAAGKPAPEIEAAAEDERPLEDRYVDDGTVTTEDKKKFSLGSGGAATVMPATRAKVPGESMSEQDVIEEIAGSRRTMILVVGAVVVSAVVVVLLMMMRGKPAPRASESANPSPAAARATTPTPPTAAPVKTAPAPAKAASAPAKGSESVPAAAAKEAVAKEEAEPPAREPSVKKKSSHRKGSKHRTKHE